MQNYIEIPANEPFVSSRILLLNNDKTIMSNNSGTSFPTANLQVGMFCYRTDLKKLFQLIDIDTIVWRLVLDVEKGWIADAFDLPFTPVGNITATNVGDALAELDNEKVNSSDVVTSATANKILKLNSSSELPANASSATKLKTARNIAIKGDATGNSSFDGSGDVDITVTLKDVVTTGTYTKVTADSKGRITAGEDATASDIVNEPSGNIAANTVQGAINELDTEKAPKTNPSVSGLKVSDSTIISPDELRIEDEEGMVQDICVGTVIASRQIISTEESEAPLVVTSATKVVNLNADKLDGKDAGNANGNVPINNGELNVNLNAEKVGGYTFSDIDGNAFLYSLIF